MTETTDEALSVYARWYGSGIPERFWEKTIHERCGLGPPPAFEALRLWVEEMPIRQARFNGLPVSEEGFGRGLLLCGPPGTGKTTAACAALTSIRRSFGKGVFFVRWPEYLAARQQLFNTAQTVEEIAPLFEMHRTVQEVFALVLDDVGHEHSSGSGYGERLLQETVRARFDAGNPTVLTTNLQSEEWAARYDPALRSFIYQACPPVIFDGPDRRVASLGE